MRASDPIFVAPRPVARAWGRSELGHWCKSSRVEEPVGEIWIHDPANATDSGPLGARLARNAGGMLGDLGRAPPKLRIVFPDERVTVQSAAPTSLWTILEPTDRAPIGFPGGEFGHRTGERVRAYEGAAVSLSAGCVALEVSSAFQPANGPVEGPSLIRLPAVSKRMRATLFRDAALSVESWTLPDWSRIVPDGDTCHVLMALTPGVRVDGRRLQPGHALFVPAWGRPLDISGANTKVLIAYPDQRPTAIWRHVPGPDPAAGLLPKPEPARPRVDAVAQALEPALAA